jgi:Domain of unknown function (DUF4129)
LHLTLLAVIVLSGAQPHRGAATFDLQGYVAELDRVSAQIAAASTPPAAQAATETVRDRWFVTMDDEIVIVDVSWIDAGIAAAGNASEWPRVRARITGRLAAMRAEATMAPPPDRTQNPGATLAEVMSRTEFQKNSGSRWLEEQRNRVSQWILQMLNRLTGSAMGSRTLGIVFAWAASLLALSAFAIWLVTTLTRRSNAAALELGAAAPTRAAAREWALRAMTAARAGDVREAVRCAYHAVVSRLDEQGTWRIDESRTPREYLALLPAGDPRAAALTELTGQFEQIWYGQRPPTGDDAQRVADYLERLGCLHAADRAI